MKQNKLKSNFISQFISLTFGFLDFVFLAVLFLLLDFDFYVDFCS